MSPHDAPRVDEILYDALQLPPNEREPFLADSCEGNPNLLEEVRSLLGVNSAAEGFLSTPPVDFRDPPGERDPIEKIGVYQILGVIGSGGMGTVFEAQRDDQQFQKKVAIKVIKRGMDTADILRRFKLERQVLAGLEHPNVARLLDGGATDDGRPYLVMELVEGVPIDRYCREQNLSVEDRITLFRMVCEAVHYAHQNLVVHRDLKPGNILVTPEGQVKLLDFGISKVILPGEERMATQTTVPLLTPRYASPEQVLSEPITTGSDVYSLGVVLYELLTGVSPYEVELSSLARLEQTICATDPTKPSSRVRSEAAGPAADTGRWARRLAGDLDNIVLKALQKEPARRYETVDQFSADLGRHLEGLPVAARPDTVRYRTWKFVRRNRVPVALVGALFLLVSLTAVVSTSLFVRADRAQKESESQRLTAETIAHFLEDALGSIDPSAAQGRDVSILREILDATAARVDSELDANTIVAASLHSTIGRAYQSLDLYDHAAYHQGLAIATFRRLLSADDPALADALYHHASFLDESDQLAEAEAVYREALDIRRNTAHPDELAIARIRNGLGRTLNSIGRYDEAEPHLIAASEVANRVLGPDDPESIDFDLGLGWFLTTQDMPGRAEPILFDALARARRIEDLQILNSSLSTAAFLLRWQEQYAESEELYREALLIGDELYGEMHSSRGNTLGQLASVLEFQEKFGEAELFYRENLAIALETYGPDHHETGTILNNLAGLLRKTGRYEEAEALMSQAIEVYRKSLGTDHAWVAIALSNYAALLEKKGDYEQVEIVALECLELCRDHWAADHWRVAQLQSIRAGAKLQLGNCTECEQLLLDALPSLESAFGVEDSRVLNVLEQLVAVYEATGDHEEAERYRLLMKRSNPSS